MGTDDLRPLVSCLMPTCDRRRFVARAIEYFLRQDYEPRELLIVDDGSDPIADLVPEDPRIRYLRRERKLKLGAKRNLACGEAKGEIFVHWDDDDWHAPWRLSYQVARLVESGAELCGLDRLYFYDPKAERGWQYVYPPGGRKWLAGGTLCYTRSFWQRHPFPEVTIGEDNRFVRAAGAARMTALEDGDFYVALIHPRNTSRKRTAGRRWQRCSSERVRDLLGDDLKFYRGLAESPAPRRRVPRRRAASKEDSSVKLNLGCCDALLPGFVNVDRVPAPGVEVVDLAKVWPWPDGSVEMVRAWDVIEHLPDKILTMNETWRVLRPGGRVEIAVPTTDGPGAFQDPTHVSFWNRRSFLYYEAGNPYRERFAGHYGIRAKFKVVSEKITKSLDGPRLTIVLEAVKP